MNLPAAPADPRVATILALLRSPAAAPCPFPPLSGDEWAAVLRFARDESVLRPVISAIRARGIALPFIAQQRLLRAERREIGESLAHTAALKQLLAALHAAGVDVIPLKGPVLVERLYGDPLARPCLDLDLLIRERDWQQASAALLTLGYLPDLHREEPHKLNWHRGGAVGSQTLVELHTAFEDAPLMRLAMNEVWARTQPASFGGLPILRLHPADELTALAMHAARHRFDRLSILYELALAFERLPEQGLGAEPIAAETIVPGILALGRAMAERFVARPLKTPAIALDPALQRRVTRLAAELWQETLTQQRPDLRWRGRFRFLLALEPNRRRWLLRRGRHLQRAALRVEQADYALAARFGLRSDAAALGARWLRLAYTILCRFVQGP